MAPYKVSKTLLLNNLKTISLIEFPLALLCHENMHVMYMYTTKKLKEILEQLFSMVCIQCQKLLDKINF